MTKKIVAIVGMPGAGKSEVADFFIKKGFLYIRLGQIVLDELMRKNLPSGEKSERKIREEMRKKHGMAAMAILNMPKIKKLSNNIIIDGLYSWEEYLYFKKNLSNIIVVAVYASPLTRIQRLVGRAQKHGSDPKMKYRSFTIEEAKSRDHAQIQNLHQAGPIAMADFTILNEETKKDLKINLNKIWKKINAPKEV